jgi:U4/U6.U5 tri-snRNP-associated protein 1
MAEQNGGDVARGMKSEGHSWAAASSEIDKKHHRKAATADEGTIGEGTTEEALSVEDTNRLREKLGLAPLNHSAGNDVSARGAEQLDAKKDEHRIAREKEFQEREAQQLSERVSEQREVRRMRETLRNTRGIADQEDNDADADVNAFVRKQKQAERRQKEDEKHKAERTAQMLAERAHFDEEAALSEHARKESRNDIARDGNVLPTGIGVQHRADEIAEGQEMEMTLEDSHILNEKGELNENGASVSLQNVKLSEERKRARARQAAARTQSGKRVEDPFSADAGDEERLLPQYDDEVEGALADGERMHIDSSGTLKQNETDENKDRGHPGEQDGDATENGKLEVGKRLHERLKNVREESATFSSRDLGQQREYYTKEEMAQFATRNKTKQGKKKQHKKNLRKSKLTAEELEQIAAEEQQQKQREGHEHSEDGADVDVRARNREAQQAQAAESKIADELRRREAFERAKEREAENTRQKIGSAPREKSRRAETEGQHGATGDADDEEHDHDLGRALERSQRTLETITTPSAQQSVFASRSSAQNRRYVSYSVCPTSMRLAKAAKEGRCDLLRCTYTSQAQNRRWL